MNDKGLWDPGEMSEPEREPFYGTSISFTIFCGSLKLVDPRETDLEAVCGSPGIYPNLPVLWGGRLQVHDRRRIVRYGGRKRNDPGHRDISLVVESAPLSFMSGSLSMGDDSETIAHVVARGFGEPD